MYARSYSHSIAVVDSVSSISYYYVSWSSASRTRRVLVHGIYILNSCMATNKLEIFISFLTLIVSWCNTSASVVSTELRVDRREVRLRDAIVLGIIICSHVDIFYFIIEVILFHMISLKYSNTYDVPRTVCFALHATKRYSRAYKSMLYLKCI
jgi:hypothetical protein